MKPEMLPDGTPASTSLDERPDRAGVRDRATGRMRRAINFVRQRGLLATVRLVRTHGFRESCRFVGRNIRYTIAVRADRAYDRQNGVDTAGSIQLGYLDVVGPNRQHGTEYVSTSPKSFAWIMRHLKYDFSDQVFIDLGAGKGRSVLLAARYPFSKVIGVEFAHELALIAKGNLQAYRGPTLNAEQMDMVHADAAQFEFPEQPMTLYFYNPFGRDVLAKVLHNLNRSLENRPRKCCIIYASSLPETLEWARPLIVGTGLFTERATMPMPMFLDAVRTLKFAVFDGKPETGSRRLEG